MRTGCPPQLLSRPSRSRTSGPRRRPANFVCTRGDGRGRRCRRRARRCSVLSRPSAEARAFATRDPLPADPVPAASSAVEEVTAGSEAPAPAVPDIFQEPSPLQDEPEAVVQRLTRPLHRSIRRAIWRKNSRALLQRRAFLKSRPSLSQVRQRGTSAHSRRPRTAVSKWSVKAAGQAHPASRHPRRSAACPGSRGNARPAESGNRANRSGRRDRRVSRAHRTDPCGRTNRGTGERAPALEDAAPTEEPQPEAPDERLEVTERQSAGSSWVGDDRRAS